MSNARNSGPLAGIRVVDFGQYVAGPGAAMMLADQGAEVIRVERPGGPSMQTPANAVLNRRKQVVTLDLTQPGDRHTAVDLASRADVLIENFRPGVMARLGLGYEAVRSINPRLVYLSLPGFASTDAENAQTAAWEGVVAAAMGQFTDMGLNRVLMGIEASYSPLTLASAYGSLFGVLAVTLALRARLATGRGDRIELPLAAALMEGLAYNSLWIENLPERYKTLRETEIERRRREGLPMTLTYGDLQPLLDPFYRTYKCRDGRPFYVVSEAHATHAERALRVLGIWDELLAEGLPTIDPYIPRAQWPAGVDCTIRAYPLSERWALKLSKRMALEFLKKDASEWERLFGEAKAPAAAHRTTKEWLNSTHPREAGLVIEVADTEYGAMLQPGPIAWLKGCPPAIGEGSSARPDFAADALSAARLPDSTAVSPARPWLQGITILDLTNVIAGPTIAGTLVRFGARVIKIDPVTPTYDPYNTVACGIYANQSKESALVDLKTPGGREVFDRLLKTVDIITINAAEKQLAALGLSPERLRARNPRVILCHLDAFGGPRRGPRSDYPGYDDLVQASTGVMERFGGSLDTVEEHAHFGTIDVLGGIAAAFGAALALLRRESSGEGDVARSSLAAAGQWLQSRFMYDYSGRPPFDEPRGRATQGEGLFYRCYRASDGWFFLAGKGLTAIDGGLSELIPESVSARGPEELEKVLAAQFAKQPVAFWKEQLAQFHLAVQPFGSLAKIRNETTGDGASSRTVAFVHDSCHPSGRAIAHVLPKAVLVDQAPLVPLLPAQKYGQSTRALMLELGFSDAEIKKMLNVRAISESWCDPYLPD